MHLKDKKVCLVTDWLTNIGGGERVLMAIAELFPDAPILTTVCDPKNIGKLVFREIRTSWLQHIPLLHKKHQMLLPLLPQAIESLDTREFDIILSFSSAVAKSVRTFPHQKHICYIHTPIRYAWEPDFDSRIQGLPPIVKSLAKWDLEHIRRWDYLTKNTPSHYIANSSMTSSRVEKYYGINPDILYPPVEQADFSLAKKKQDFYLGLGRMVPYKKFPLLAEAFAKMSDKKLILIGEGPDYKKTKAIADKYPNIEMKGFLSREEVAQHMRDAKGFLLPQLEDAGIVQLEACSSGTPVIAYGKGGSLDVIKEGVNGVFFHEQTPESIAEAVQQFETKIFDPEKVRESVKKHDVKAFQQQYLNLLGKWVK